MTTFIALDCETTGLPTSRKGPKNFQDYDTCRLVSVGIVIFEDGKEVDSLEMIVKPDGYTVTAEEIHGLSHEHCLSNGMDWDVVYNNLQYIIQEYKHVVGHNLAFDMSVINAECYRRGYTAFAFDSTTCTLKLSKQVLSKGFKLGILYRLLTGETLEDAHSAVPDARASGVVYNVLKNISVDNRTIEPHTVYIKVSDVAACIGMNPYKQPGEVMDLLLEKYVPEKYYGISKSSKQKLVINRNSNISNLVESVKQTVTTCSNETSALFETCNNIIHSEKDLSENEKSLVKEFFRKEIYTSYGIEHESAVADSFGETCYEDNTFYKHKIATINGTNYVICGRIDRFTVNEKGEKVLIEIKNRANRLFGCLKDYEKIQVQTYMFMTGMKEAKLVERLDGTDAVYPVEYDVSAIEKYFEKLQSFVKSFHILASI